MAESCCNKRCFFRAVAYVMAVLQILSGLSKLTSISILYIVGGLMSISLGILLLVGIIQNKKNLVLAYIIIQGILLGIVLAVLIGASIYDSSSWYDENTRTLMVVYLAIVAVTCVLLGVLYLEYREMKKSEEAEAVWQVESGEKKIPLE